MARPTKALPIPATDGFDPQRLEDAGAAAKKLDDLHRSYGQGRDLVNQLLGQAQMADALSKLTATVAVSKMAFVKENKLYQSLAGMKDRDGCGLTGTWEEFCKLLGTSAPKVNEDISNLQAFGEEALESMSQAGIGYRDLRQFRRLPEDQRTALIEVAKSGDKESFVELAEEIIAKHAKEKESLAQKIDEGQKQLADKDAVIVQKTAKIEELVEDKNRREGLTGAELHAELERDLTKNTLIAVGEMTTLRSHINAIQELDKLPQGLHVACANALQRIVSEAMSIATDYGIQLMLAAEPDGLDFLDNPNAGESAGSDWIEQAK